MLVPLSEHQLRVRLLTGGDVVTAVSPAPGDFRIHCLVICTTQFKSRLSVLYCFVLGSAGN